MVQYKSNPQSPPPAFRMPSTSTPVTDYLYNAKLAIGYLRECPREVHRWELALDRFKVLAKCRCEWKQVSPFVKTLVNEFSAISSVNPTLARDATAVLAKFTAYFSTAADNTVIRKLCISGKTYTIFAQQADINSKVLFRLIEMNSHYSKMSVHSVAGNRLAEKASRELNSAKASDLYEKAGNHFMRSGFASGALSCFIKAHQALLISADLLSPAALMNRQVRLRSSINISRELMIRAGSSLPYAEHKFGLKMNDILSAPTIKFNFAKMSEYVNSPETRN